MKPSKQLKTCEEVLKTKKQDQKDLFEVCFIWASLLTPLTSRPFGINDNSNEGLTIFAATFKGDNCNRYNTKCLGKLPCEGGWV